MLFISMYKPFSFSRYLNFCLDFLVIQKNGLIRKIRLIFKFMTLQSGKQIIVMHILPNISRRKDHQTMKLGQLIEYNMRNNFLGKSYTKCGGETTPRIFSKKSKVSISLDQQFKVLHGLFLLYGKFRAIQWYRNYAADYLFLPHIKIF